MAASSAGLDLSDDVTLLAPRAGAQASRAARAMPPGLYAPIWLAGDEAMAPERVPLSPACQRLLDRVPLAVRQSFTADQLAALSRASVPPPSRHDVDVRFTLPVLGRRFYVVFLGGHERRSRERLLRDGQRIVARASFIYALLMCLAVTAGVFAGFGVLYAAKELLGLDAEQAATLNETLVREHLQADRPAP